ncbi:MAG: hypothetical protein IJ219_02390 [Bacteroidaceae bacterium]|nr:hypothetical protein [Bacteroidaceae bacterium]
MKPEIDNNTADSQPLPWLVMYSNSSDINILDILDREKLESATTGIHDFFVPTDVMRLVVDGKSIERRRLIAGNYVFLQATMEDILRLRKRPPFDATLRFLRPSTSPTGCIYISDDEMQMMLAAVNKMDGEVDYFVPSSKELMISDIVQVVEGRFAGIKGFLESVKGHEGGCVIVPLGDVLAVRTPRVSADDIRLVSLAKVSESQYGSYTSRAYKKIRVLMEDSEKLLEEKETRGSLSQESETNARRLVMRFSQLKLAGKIRLMHAQAIYNLLIAIGDTESDLFMKYKNMLP